MLNQDKAEHIALFRYGLVAPLVEQATDLAAPANWGVVSTSGIAELLTQLYQDRQLLAAQQQLAHAYATSAQLNWGNIATRWAQLFSQLAGPAA